MFIFSDSYFSDDSNGDFNDRISDHSVDDRHSSIASKRQTSVCFHRAQQNDSSLSLAFSSQTTGTEYQQLSTKVDFMQKIIDRYESKIHEMQRELDSLISINESQRENNERLNTELTDLIDLHQIEVSSIKTDLKNLEQRLIYKFNDYWNELLEKLDKLDTRVSSLDNQENICLPVERRKTFSLSHLF